MKPYNHDIYLNGYKAVTFESPLRLGTYDSYGNERIRVLCSPEWDGLTIVATFKAASAVEVLVDADGMLDVPPEATATQQAAAGRCALTFVGTGEGRQTISCTTYYLVQDHATVGNVTPDPTPDKWQQFVDQVAADRAGAVAAAKEAARSAQDAKTAESNAKDSADNAASSATAAKSSETAAAKSADDAKNYAAQVAGIVTSQAIFGVNFSGSASAGTRVGAAKDFVFTPGTDTSAGQNSFDVVYPWAGMRRCCCTLNADGTVKVNAYKGQPGYIEDGTNGEVLVEIPLFYVSGMLDVAPSISMSMLPGYRAPRKFINTDGSLKQKCYVRAFPGSIGADGKLHSIAGAVPAGNQNITQFLNAARKWGDTYSIGTSADFEVLAYLMIVVYGTRNAQSKINGCVSLYGTNIAVAAATDNAASVVVAKSAGIEPGMVISIGTGDESETIARRRIVTSVEAIDGDATNVKVNFDGDPVTATTDHKVWRIMQSTGTANSVIATCGSPVSNTDGRHSFVFYGVENPLYGNQWRFECDWKLVDGVPYWCDDPTKYSWTSNDGYIALDTMAMPDEGWATALQQDDRAPSVQITKSVGGSSGTYLADYFYINKAGTRIALRGGASSYGGNAGPFYVDLNGGAGYAWWSCGGDLSIPG